MKAARGSEAAAGDGGDGGRRVIGVLALIALLMAGAAAVFAVLWWSERSLAAQRQQVLDVAESMAVDFTTYDYRQIEQDMRRVTDFATESYAQTYRKASEPLAELIVEGKARSEGEVRNAGIASMSDERAVVLLHVDQSITNVNVPKSRIDRDRMEMTLVKVDGEWKLDGVVLG